jgi:hypothetical protein
VSIPESVTFEEAIALTQSLMSQMTAGELSAPEISQPIAQLVKSENGARGFFVTYLTSDGTLADHPSPEVIQALQSSPDIVTELLVKNLAMSSAQAVTHRRKGNEEMAQGSDRVRSRTISLLEKLKLPQLRERSVALYESATTGEGIYQTFLQRWGYDAQQRQVICEALDQVMGEIESEPNLEQ